MECIEVSWSSVIEIKNDSVSPLYLKSSLSKLRSMKKACFTPLGILSEFLLVLFMFALKVSNFSVVSGTVELDSGSSNKEIFSEKYGAKYSLSSFWIRKNMFLASLLSLFLSASINFFSSSSLSGNLL